MRLIVLAAAISGLVSLLGTPALISFCAATNTRRRSVSRPTR